MDTLHASLWSVLALSDFLVCAHIVSNVHTNWTEQDLELENTGLETKKHLKRSDRASFDTLTSDRQTIEDLP